MMTGAKNVELSGTRQVSTIQRETLLYYYTYSVDDALEKITLINLYIPVRLSTECTITAQKCRLPCLFLAIMKPFNFRFNSKYFLDFSGCGSAWQTNSNGRVMSSRHVEDNDSPRLNLIFLEFAKSVLIKSLFVKLWILDLFWCDWNLIRVLLNNWHSKKKFICEASPTLLV